MFSRGTVCHIVFLYMILGHGTGSLVSLHVSFAGFALAMFYLFLFSRRAEVDNTQSK